MNNTKKVYLDYAATSPVKPEVLEAILPYLTENFGNPSSIHYWGRAARTAVDEAREKVAQFLGATPREIIFTSGGSESDNLAIKGIISKFEDRNSKQIQNSNIQLSENGQRTTDNFNPHIITSVFEHHAVLNTCKALEKNGIEVTYIKPNQDGIIGTEEIKKAIKDNTVLVSIMYVNNEIGTVQPIAEIGKIIEKINGERSTVNGERIFFHTDAVQATEYQNMNVDHLHVDLLTISGHKIGAPKGIGALYIRKGTPVMPMMHGGEQEFNLRAGTENVAGIVAIAKAVEIIGQRTTDNGQLTKLRDYFIGKILNEVPETYLNGSKELRSPNNANFYFKYIEGESILLNLDLAGIAASSGSACASHSLQPSHVIMSVYNDAERAHGSIRFTLGQETSKEDLDYTIEKIKEIVKKLRAMSPLTPKELRV